MKIKITLLFLLTLLIVSALSLSTAFAQYELHTQIGLPKGAKARFGTGFFTDIAYLHNATTTRFAVDSSIGTWIYDAETLQVLYLLTGHIGQIVSSGFSPDGSTVAIGLDNGVVELWDVATGTLHSTLEGPGRTNGVFFSPDGSTLVTMAVSILGVLGNVEDRVHLWDVNTGTLRSVLEHTTDGHTDVEGVSFSLDGQTLATWGQDGDEIFLWDVATGTRRNTLKETRHRGKIVSFSPDGQILAIGGVTDVFLWDVATGTFRNTLMGDNHGVNSVSFSPDGQILATEHWGGEVFLWDVATGTLRNTLAGHGFGFNFVHFSPDGSTLATRGGDGAYTVFLWDVATGTLRNTLIGHNSVIQNVSFSPDGQILAAGGADGRVVLWDVATGSRRNTFTAHSDYVYRILFSPDGATLATLSDRTVKWWRVSTGTLRKTFSSQYGWKTYIVGFSFDEGPLGSRGNHPVLLGDVATGTFRESLENTPIPIIPSFDILSASPDGSTFVTTNYNTAYLWDTATGTLLNTVESDENHHIYSVSFSPDSGTLATGSGIEIYYEPEFAPILDPQVPQVDEDIAPGCKDPVRLWDVTTGQQKLSPIGHADCAMSVSFSPDGKNLASVGVNGRVYLWDVATGTLRNTFIGQTNYVLTASLSPDSKILAAADIDGRVYLWDIATGTLHNTLTEHSDYILSVSFSPDSSILAAGGADDRVYLWDVATGTLHNTFIGHNGDIYNVSFSPDGSMLASRSADGTVFLWEIGAPQQLTEDINGDGVINIQDLVLVASRFSQTGENNADVNGDGVVNIQDLVLVAAAFGNVPAAPITRHHANQCLTPEVVQQWLATAKQLVLTDATAQRGIAVLEALLAALTPKETALLPNYPNPFNPETWIPYQLAAAADVSVLIYSADGKLVRTLKLGQQAAGVYESRSRAAYWDGKNGVGEAVASGVYFYTLKTDDFTATRKMLIRK